MNHHKRFDTNTDDDDAGDDAQQIVPPGEEVPKFSFEDFLTKQLEKAKKPGK